MRRNAIVWFVISALLFVAAGYFWHLGNERRATRVPAPPAAPRATGTNAGAAAGTNPAPAAGVPVITVNPETAIAGGPYVGLDARYPWQVRNSRKSVGELVRSETAVLLQNALIETAEPSGIRVAPHLRAGADDGSYIVQAAGVITERFRRQLQSVGAEIISYIPNNAYLVRTGPGGAQALASLADARTVIPYDPQFKLNTPQLLELAIKQQPLPDGTKLNVTTFPGTREPSIELFNQLGAEVVSESRSPFGPLFVVATPPDALVTLAASPLVQGLEINREKQVQNDLSRTAFNLTTNTDTATLNWLGLTGVSTNASNSIWVNLNDTGVDTNHPDLSPRVISDTFDFVGHGTHTAGTIMSSGLNSPQNPNPNFPGANGTNNVIGGSAVNPPVTVSYRGMAPAASIYAVNFSFANVYLQTNAAMRNYNTLARTNPMVSNNSWGYPAVFTYDSSAASFDAAVRDALPEQPGMQQMLYVFSAGNSGIAGDDGIGFASGTITSPATAKNVISVGALENRRLFTNALIFSNNLFVCTGHGFATNIYTTNIPGYGTNLVTNVVVVCTNGYATNIVGTNFNYFLSQTDSSNQVAYFSSRGNVDPGLEGLYGRFKPDVVAPGVFTVSTRSSAFTRPSTDPFGINALLNRIDLLLTNSPPYYRFDSGTSMAAPAVTGLLALFQEYFETHIAQGYSPALLKALLINGARSASQFGPSYHFAVNDTINDQGWGLPNITNSIPSDLGLPSANVQFFDQSLTNSLATGDSHTYLLSLNNLGTNLVPSSNYPIRITLVWTDPPGNPSAAVKLVNDLDLIVTNLANSNVYYGNNFGAEVFTPPIDTTGSNPVVIVKDSVNNVENVYIEGPLDASYAIIVKGARVNVNARTDHPDNVVQDYALVISSDYPIPGSGAFTVTGPAINPNEVRPTLSLDNATPVLRQHVGANTPLIGGPEGIPNQWDFYIFTNTAAASGSLFTNNGTNVAFVTFLPPDLSVSTHAARSTLPRVTPRNVSADIDLYVSADPNLTNLLPATLAAAWKSTNRGGDELVIVPGANVGDVYYIGVKSEDYRGAEYALIGLSTQNPFATRTSNGAVLYGIPVPQLIPDGDPLNPSVAYIMGINPYDFLVQRVVVTNDIEHELFGDLYADLFHPAANDPAGGRYAVLFSHNLFDGLYSGRTTNIFDDSGRGDMTNSIRTDLNTETSLNNFVGDRAAGTWRYTVSDNALYHTGQVWAVNLFVEERATNTTNRTIILCAGEQFLDFVDVPQNATNLTVSLLNLTGGQVEMYVRRDDPATAPIEFPTPTTYDKRAIINPPGGSLTIGLGDVPPLQAGRYYVLVTNLDPVCIQFQGPVYQLDINNSPGARFSIGATNVPVTVQDDVVSLTTNRVSFDEEIYSVEVGVRLDHPRVSDLSMHLISPAGSRVLLFENRGLTDTNGTGAGYFVTNSVTINPTGGSVPQTNNINTGANYGTVRINYDFFTIPDRMTIYYDGALIFDSGVINGAGQFNVDFGPGVGTNVVIVMNEPVGNSGTRWTYSATVITGVGYLIFSEDTNQTALPIKFTLPPFNLGTNQPLYVRPEESLDTFKGEHTRGSWLLELWDTRVGAALTNGLISWNLRFTFAGHVTPASALPLANCITLNGTVPARSTNFFYIDAPGNASGATNTLTVLTGGPLLLGADRSGVPVVASPPDDYIPASTAPTGTAIITMSTNSVSPPPLLPGQRYYLGVRNPNAVSATFTLTACIGADLSVGTNSVTYPSAIPTPVIPVGQASLTKIASGTGMDYYRFNVASNAAAVLFSINGLSGNAGVVVRKADGTGPALPTRSVNDLSASAPGIPLEQVLFVNSNAFSGVPVAAGIWNLGVFHQDTTNNNYSIELMQVYAPTNDAIQLSNGVSVNFTVPGGLGEPWLYRFTVPPTNTAALFELFGASGNVDLLLSPGQFPASPLYSSALTGASPEQVVLLTNATGDYAVVVANHQTNDVNFTLRAVVNETNGMLLSAQPLIAAPDRFLSGTSSVPVLWNSIPGQRYVIEMSADLVTWAPYATNVATGAIGRFFDASPAGAQPKRYYRVRQVAP